MGFKVTKSISELTKGKFNPHQHHPKYKITNYLMHDGSLTSTPRSIAVIHHLCVHEEDRPEDPVTMWQHFLSLPWWIIKYFVNSEEKDQNLSVSFVSWLYPMYTKHDLNLIVH